MLWQKNEVEDSNIRPHILNDNYSLIENNPLMIRKQRRILIYDTHFFVCRKIIVSFPKVSVKTKKYKNKRGWCLS